MIKTDCLLVGIELGLNLERGSGNRSGVPIAYSAAIQAVLSLGLYHKS